METIASAIQRILSYFSEQSSRVLRSIEHFEETGHIPVDSVAIVTRQRMQEVGVIH